MTETAVASRLLTYREKLEIITSPELLAKWYNTYSLPTADAIVHFINNWCYGYDPRLKTNKISPFILYPRQEEFIRWLWRRYYDQEEGVISKSRDVGFSFMICAFSLWLIVFHRDVSVGMHSMKEADLHRLGDVSSLMEKAIFMSKRLPKPWVAGIYPKHLEIHNHFTNSNIVGSTGEEGGRSGRRSLYFIDEADMIPHAENLEAALSQVTTCRIYGSTHKSTATLFYRKYTAGFSPVFIFEYHDIPSHDEKWLAAQRSKAEAEGTLSIFRREILREVVSDNDQTLIKPEWIDAARNSEHVPGRKILALDIAAGGKDSNFIVVRDGNAICGAHDRYDISDPTVAVEWAFWMAVELGCDEFRYDIVGVGAGAHGDAKRCQEKSEDPVAKKMRLVPYMSSGKVSRPKDIDYGDKPNADMFANKKAQDYFTLRHRFLQSYRKSQGLEYDADMTICILDDGIDRNTANKLFRELAQPEMKASGAGKMLIDKAPAGASSPNGADASNMAFAEVDAPFREWYFA